MQYPGYTTGQVVLSEGRWYPFRIHNRLQLQDGQWYYVLQDINGLKHFMPAGPYESYSLKTGEEISCRIDRINCTGRIFLEPRHPVYREGEKYDFDVLSVAQKEGYYVLSVKDIFGNSIEVQQYGYPVNDSEVNKTVCCVVNNIKKGKPDIEISDVCP